MKPYLLNRIRKRINLPKPLNDYLVNKFPLFFFLPHMNDNEFKLFCQYAKSGDIALEFGSGGSTFFFIGNKQQIFSIENNEPYYKFMNDFNIIKNSKKLNYRWIDTGKCLEWGVPADESEKENWPDYYTAIWNENNIKCPDIIFIDGRFRVMCALESLNYINHNTTVIIHDFFNRDYYFIILDYFDIVAKVDSLAILKKKDHINNDNLREAKKNYIYDFR